MIPSIGCPESGRLGWRQGYISFTWKQPHIMTSVSYCDFNIENIKPENAMITNETKRHICSPILPPDEWARQSILRGPFNAYEWRLNFCFKIKDESVKMNQSTWPNAHYSIFGDGKDCPIGFTLSERTIELPEITSWMSYGHLPGFSITENKDDTATLILNTCNHNPVDDGNYVFPFSGLFMLLKDENDDMCPNIPFADVITEAVQLKPKEGSVEVRNLFELCYVKRNTSQPAISSYLYIPQNELPYKYKTVFAISNPTLIFGNSTSAKPGSSKIQATDKPLWTHIYDHTTTPWLVVDIGRNFIVTGIQFDNYYLLQVVSRDFLGFRNTSVSGWPCQRWDSQSPHEHSMKNNDYFPDATVSDAENFCRDPSGDGYIWCYIDLPYIRWEECATSVYSFKETERPFIECFISETRWRLDNFEGVRCEYSVYYENDILYFEFQRPLEGRYLKLIGHEGADMLQFHKAIRDIKVLTTEYLTYDGSRCNNDLGMGDESILDYQITASSWLEHTPPTSGRPFSPGWCASYSDSQPHITVDLETNTHIEGVTFYNWEFIEEDTAGGVFRKKYLPIGSKKVMIRYKNADNEAIVNKNYSFNMFLPIDQPQTFSHNPVLARYVSIYIIESLIQEATCLRFELHGCKRNSRPKLLAIEWHSNYLQKEEMETITSIQILNEPSIITSINYPQQYAGGETYTWKIVFESGKYIQLLFTNILLNIHTVNHWGDCQDMISLHPEYVKDRMAITEDVKGLVTLVDMDSSNMTLTFTSCRPTSKIRRSGNGFKAIVQEK
ncbi:uncharacterized protein LOC132735460, partial [Ruditapes philippinarum]|uniref:uncharacterized protein LOC132735460 n=1 Tax=Ruditapes philippinarum TaxID=129788 RepID=UPI00295B9664